MCDKSSNTENLPPAPETPITLAKTGSRLRLTHKPLHYIVWTTANIDNVKGLTSMLSEVFFIPLRRHPLKETSCGSALLRTIHYLMK